jgi:hypothetical protein
MNRTTKLWAVTTLGAIVIALAPALPSSAVTRCYPPTDTGTEASTVCEGVGGAVRLNVTCNAIWPFPVWTDYGTWVTLIGSTYVTNTHARCLAPLSYGFDFKP